MNVKDTVIDLKSSALLFNRELSWLEFNFRVLEEAQDKTNPIFERLKFLAITSSNLDEFFMVRVAGLMALAESGFNGKDPSGLTPTEQLEKLSISIHNLVAEEYRCFTRSISRTLKNEGIEFKDISELNNNQRNVIERYFNITLYPILTPMAIDKSRPFPLLSNKSLNLILEIKEKKEEIYAVVQVPSVVPRFFEIPADEQGKRFFILIEDIIKEFSSKLFMGKEVEGIYAFRITRNSDFIIDEEDAEDLLFEIEKSLKKRKWGEPVRLEIEKNMKKSLRKFLEKMLKIDDKSIYEISGPLDLTFLMGFTNLKFPDHLKNELIRAVEPPDFIDKDVFSAIKEKDILVYHPYESFDCVLNFVKSAASDPQVLAIKQTLYRVSGNSPIVKALIEAAENGKQVTVLVELKARFDEENNIIWAKKLEHSGCHVIYGLVGYKTHCKICLVVRKENDGIHRYIHLGTGNYNDSTAKIYTDLGLFTCKEPFGSDISSLFNVLTGYAVNTNYNKIIVAPINLRKTFIEYIKNEAQNARNGIESIIIAKMNSLVDPEIISELYSASISGVKIKLIVRGICCLKPGIEGISDNITVVSIVDRYLEHSRIFYFENGGWPKVLLSSADWMQRNFDRRVEIAFPVEDEALKQRLKDDLDLILSDTVKLRTLQRDGTYSIIDGRGRERVHSQLEFHNLASEKHRLASEIPETEKFKPANHIKEMEQHVD